MLTTLRRIAVIAIATAIAAVGVTTPASATTSLTLNFVAGQVCDFPLTVTGSGDTPKVYREFLDRHGDVRAILSAGKGLALTYTNAATGTKYSTPANGAVNWTVYHADGSQTIQLLGHNVVFLFPTDIGGPSTTLYTGLVRIKVNAAGVWEVVQHSGKGFDICARLS